MSSGEEDEDKVKKRKKEWATTKTERLQRLWLLFTLPWECRLTTFSFSPPPPPWIRSCGIHIMTWTETESEHVRTLPGLRMRISQYVHTFTHVSTTACQNRRSVPPMDGEGIRACSPPSTTAHAHITICAHLLSCQYGRLSKPPFSAPVKMERPVCSLIWYCRLNRRKYNS